MLSHAPPQSDSRAVSKKSVCIKPACEICDLRRHESFRSRENLVRGEFGEFDSNVSSFALVQRRSKKPPEHSACKFPGRE